MGEQQAYKLALSKPVICVVGPTASGKSTLAELICQEIDGEVVSADSMQIYKGMDIGTGKVLPDERTVPYHGLDLIDPGEPYSAALFQTYARNAFEDIDARDRRSVLCGGTGFYVRAAIDDYDFPAGEQVGNDVRDHYTQRAREIGTQALWEELRATDPESAAYIEPNDTKRIVRAFELLSTGESYAKQKENLSKIAPFVPVQMFGIQVDPDILRERIDSRVDTMIEEGLVSEVEQLIQNGFREAITAPQAIGYKEIAAYLDGSCTLDEAITAIKFATHRYAKRQRTWFRKDKRIHWLNGDQQDYEQMLEYVLRSLATMDS